MENEKIQIGIKEIQNIKMTPNEKENVLKNVFNGFVPIKKPIKSPYSFASILRRNHFAYYVMAVCLILIVLGGGEATFNSIRNQNNNTGNLAFVPNLNQTNSAKQENLKIGNKKIGKSNSMNPANSSFSNQDNKNILPTAPMATMMAPTTGSSYSNNTSNTQNNKINVSLENEFTLAQNQLVIINSTGLEIKILGFSNSPCTGECVWSGMGINFEYTFKGETRSGMNLMQAFGYQTKVIETDYKTYAKIVITKI